MGQDDPLQSSGDEWTEGLPRRPRAVRRSTKKRGAGDGLSRQARERLMLIGVNAALSLIISLVVVIAWDTLKQPSQVTPTAAAVATLTATPTSAAPTATWTPGPGEPVVYRVQPGDTLLTIANQFGVTVDEIMAANGLENPNFIQAGQELSIPVGGLPTAAPTATPVPQSTDTPGPSPTLPPPSATPTETPTSPAVTPPATEPDVSIREIVEAGDLDQEAVFIFNSGRSVLMEGWTLSDAQDNAYTFPNLFLGTGGSVRVHTGAGSNSATDLYWGLDAPVWGEPGDVATLRDESGLAIDTLELP